MSGSKRARPEGNAEGAGSREPSAKVLKEDTVAIHEATLSKLKLGAARAAGSATGGNLRADASSLELGKQQQQHDFENGSKSDGGVAHCQMHQGLVLVASGLPISMNGAPITTPKRNCGRCPCPCYVCVARDSAYICFHCSRGCCEHCSRRCEGCQELFCSFCSTSNYNERYDRSFCFDCSTKASCNHSMNLQFHSICNEAPDMDWL